MEGKISYKEAPDKYDCWKWLMFQVSGKVDPVNKKKLKRADQQPGQGPYFGQLTWFARFHKPTVPSAIERYANEMERILGVLDKSLTNQQWLVGDKCTYADLSFVTWSHVAKGLVQELGMSDITVKFPHYVRWLEAMEARQPVRECLEAIVAARAAHGLPP